MCPGSSPSSTPGTGPSWSSSPTRAASASQASRMLRAYLPRTNRAQMRHLAADAGPGVRFLTSVVRFPAGGDHHRRPLMRSVARWCYEHRFAVLGAWIVVLFATFFGASSTGSSYAAGTQLSGTPSAQAAALLQRAAPSVAGDTETIVFEAKTGHVTDPAVRTQIQQMLAKVGHLQYLSGITSPYTAAGAKQVTATGKIP